MREGHSAATEHTMLHPHDAGEGDAGHAAAMTSREQFTRMASQSNFGGSEIQAVDLGLEIFLTKQGSADDHNRRKASEISRGPGGAEVLGTSRAKTARP
jgi:hypothetical protein